MKTWRCASFVYFFEFLFLKPSKNAKYVKNACFWWFLPSPNHKYQFLRLNLYEYYAIRRDIKILVKHFFSFNPYFPTYGRKMMYSDIKYALHTILALIKFICLFNTNKFNTLTNPNDFLRINSSLHW